MTMLLTYPENLEVLTPAASDIEDILNDILPTVKEHAEQGDDPKAILDCVNTCLLYTSPSPRD